MTDADRQDEFCFVDAHVHFYDMSHPELVYADWLPDADDPLLGTQLRKLGEKNYLAEDFIQESAPHGMKKAVHVQAAIGSKDPVLETAWLQQAYQRCGVPQAIVGHVDLRAGDARNQIERHLAFPNFKGIRDFSYGDYLVSDDFRRGFALHGEYSLISSIVAQWQDMTKLATLANDFPEITIVLDHAGIPAKRNREYFDQWRGGMAAIAKTDNIFCKISGLGMGDNDWTVESIRPYVETCIDLFGCERSLFATNWPVDSIWSSYADVVTAYRKITSSFSDNEKKRLFAENAESIYRI